MPGQQNIEANEFLYEITSVKEDCYGLNLSLKTIVKQHRENEVDYQESVNEHNMPLGKRNREHTMNDIAVTWDIKYIAHQLGKPCFCIMS